MTTFKVGDKVRTVDAMPEDAEERQWSYLIALRGTVISGPDSEGYYLVSCPDGSNWYFKPHWLCLDTGPPPEFNPGDKVIAVDMMPDAANEIPGFYEWMLSRCGEVISGPDPDGNYLVRCDDNWQGWFFKPHWLRHDDPTPVIKEKNDER